jgi:hypothetical protein
VLSLCIKRDRIIFITVINLGRPEEQKKKHEDKDLARLENRETKAEEQRSNHTILHQQCLTTTDH